MIQKAHEISLEAGSKMAMAMKDVIFAAAGLQPFQAESAKDLVNYMVRRGQLGSEEADRILREIDGATDKRAVRPAARPSMSPPVPAAAPAGAATSPSAGAPEAAKAPAAKKAAKKPAEKAAAPAAKKKTAVKKK